MAYNFKNLADVELLNAMPEEANMLIEINGTTKRAPQVQIPEPVDEIALIVSSETLEEVPEGATVLAEVNGEIKRVPSDGLGGGKALIVKASNFDNAVAGVVAAGESAPEVTFTANMTFDEMMQAFAACELIGGFLFAVVEVPSRLPIVLMNYDVSTYTAPCMVLMAFANSAPVNLYWTSDGISTTEPESAEQPK